MNHKEIDFEISRLVTEKRLLQESLKRNENEIEKKEIKKRIMSINGKVYSLRRQYNNEKDSIKSTN